MISDGIGRLDALGCSRLKAAARGGVCGHGQITAAGSPVTMNDEVPRDAERRRSEPRGIPAEPLDATQHRDQCRVGNAVRVAGTARAEEPEQRLLQPPDEFVACGPIATHRSDQCLRDPVVSRKSFATDGTPASSTTNNM